MGIVLVRDCLACKKVASKGQCCAFQNRPVTDWTPLGRCLSLWGAECAFLSVRAPDHSDWARMEQALQRNVGLPAVCSGSSDVTKTVSRTCRCDLWRIGQFGQLWLY
jgi:hypothetical protein